MPSDNASERSLAARLAAHTRWAGTPPAERSAITAKARRVGPGSLEWHMAQVDPDGALSESDRRTLAENHRSAYFARLALKSAKARRKKAGAA